MAEKDDFIGEVFEARPVEECENDGDAANKSDVVTGA